MGLVEANFALIDKSEIPIWIERNFEEHRNFPVFLFDPNDPENENLTVILGTPQTIEEFGVENFVNVKILEASTHKGTYGMGGAGFFALLCETKRGTFWLTVAIWGAEQYILVDNRVLGSHSNEDLDTLFKGAVITGFEVAKKECRINLVSAGKTVHEMLICKYNDKLPPMGNGSRRKPAYKKGLMSDYLLVIYEDTELLV